MKQPAEIPPARIRATGKEGQALRARTRIANGGTPQSAPPGATSVRKVSHSLSRELADRLQSFAFFQNISESAVIEEALRALFASAPDDEALGHRLRVRGAGLRRRTNPSP